MNKIPFEYGSIAENEYFIDRIEDRRDLKTFLGGGVNVMQISPRRLGKSSTPMLTCSLPTLTACPLPK